MQLFNDFEFLPVTADLRIKFRLHLSVNDLNSKERWQRGQTVALWRQRGADRLIQTAHELNLETVDFAERVTDNYGNARIVTGTRLKEFFFTEPVIVVVRFSKAKNTRYDVHNLYIKPVLDGFVDARLLPDDQSEIVRGVFFWYEGVNPALSLSSEELQARANERERRKKMKDKRPLPPPPDKLIIYDFYKLSRVMDLFQPR